jgi:hypothetical protein
MPAWYRAHAAVLATEVYDAPPPVPLLDVSDCERRHLRPPESAAQKYREDGAIAETLGGGRVRRISIATAPDGSRANFLTGRLSMPPLHACYSAG